VPTTNRPTLGLGETLDNQRIMKLVEEALRQPENERQQYLKQECGDNKTDYEQALHYVEWEQRMQGFLLDPVIKRDAAEEIDIAVGDLLEERFRIVREVAHGGMGVVYEARDEKLDRRIALKFAKAGFANDLPPEVRHATEVSHPNVCKIYEIHTARVKQQVVDFITMEFLEGETLADRLRRGRLPLDQAVTIARQLAAGVAEAHHNGVIHGDIKSNNVVLTKTAGGGLRAVITDFGLARMQGAAKKGVWGTPGYMAPELWMGEPPSVATDLYALGVVFYEMATGEMPDRTRTPMAKSETLKATPFLEVARTKPPRVSAYWDRILGRCMDPNPKRRYQTTDLLVKALEPGHATRNTLLGVAAALAIAVTGLITYYRATAPAETVKLAVVSDGTAAAVPDAEIARLEGTKKVGFVLLAPEKLDQATHVLRVSTTKTGDTTAVHAVLSDVQSQLVIKIWDGVYEPRQMRYLPRALAGVVSAGLHLTPLPESLDVNGRARSSYLAGVKALRQDWTLAEALKDFEKANVADQDSAVVWAGLAQAELWGHQASAAKEAERQAGLRYLDTAMGHRVAADLEQAEHNYEAAETELLRAEELEPSNYENYRRLGRVYESNNQFDQALRAERRAVELEPEYYRTQLTLGSLYLEQARYQDAVAHLSKAVKLAPSLADARFKLSEAYADTGQFGRALEQLNALPHWGATEHFEFANILMYQKKDAEAIPHLLLANQLAPSVAFWMQLETAYRRVGRLAEGKQAVESGLRLDEHKLVENPNDCNTRAFLGYFSARLGQRERAESETAQALRLGPHQLDVLWVAVMTYELLGKREQALGVLQAAAVPEMLDDLKRWPDLADFTADSRFKELAAAAHAEKKETRQ